MSRFLDLTALGFRAPASKFNVDDIPDLSGKVVVITGGYAGIGKETSKAILAKNAKVYILGRNQEKANKAIEELKRITGKDSIYFHQLNLSNVKDSVESAKNFANKEKRVDILFNNAGVMDVPPGSKTEDGFEEQFGVNVLGHYAFTQELLPLLLEAAKTAPKGATRVVNVSSSGHVLATSIGIDYDSLTFDDKPKKGAMPYYFQSKLGNVLYTTELRKKYKDSGIFFVSLHPGNIQSELTRHGTGVNKWMKTLFGNLMLHPTPQGALTSLYAGTSPQVSAEDDYFVPFARQYPATHPLAYDQRAADELWQWCEARVQELS